MSENKPVSLYAAIKNFYNHGDMRRDFTYIHDIIIGVKNGVAINMQKKLTYFYMLPLLIVFAANCIFSLLKTTYFDLYAVLEVPKYKSDHPLLLIILMAAFWVLLYCLYEGLQKYLSLQRQDRIRRTTMIISGVWAASLSLFFVLLFRCGVVCDSKSLSDIASAFMRNDFSAFARGEYLHHYSFQLGMIALLETIYRLFGVENFLAFQLINVIAVTSMICLLNKITWELFEDEQILILEALISMGMLPLYLFATFVYGDLIGFALGIGAVYCGVLYIKQEKWKYLLAAGALFMLAIPIKSNVNVLLAAFLITVLLKILENRKWSLLLWLAGIAVLSQAGVYGINLMYAQRAGIGAVWEGTPKIAWIAMGMQEAKEEDNGCGWYNGYNWHVYEENEYDQEATTQACLENIKESVKRFRAEPGYAVYYFYRKFVSQWNAPTFQAMITNEWYSRYTENRSGLADFLIYGTGRRILYQLMNFFHLFMFLGATAGCFWMLKNWRLERAYLALNIFGGFLFHMIWEAQARYVLCYYVMMLPIASVGCVKILSRISIKAKKRRNQL